MSKKLSPEEQEGLLKVLQTRFEKNKQRHPSLEWTQVEGRLLAKPEKLVILDRMEETDGEPDVVGHDEKTGEYIFYDCSPESPKARRSFCYDHQALESRKEHKPQNSALAAAAEMGVTLLNEEQYRELQQFGEFDLKTSSWIVTPEAIRKLGGALFCDRRFNHVFTYHNGAESYYAARGFRTFLKV